MFITSFSLRIYFYTNIQRILLKLTDLSSDNNDDCNDLILAFVHIRKHTDDNVSCLIIISLLGSRSVPNGMRDGHY